MGPVDSLLCTTQEGTSSVGREDGMVPGEQLLCSAPSWERGSLLPHARGRAGQQCSIATLVSPPKRRKISWLHTER